MKMKGFAYISPGVTGWIEKEIPEVGPYDALIHPQVVSVCTTHSP